MPRILYILFYISSVTPTSSLETTSLVSTNAVSIPGPSSSVGKIVTFTNYMVMILVSSLSLTTFEHYENLANTYSNSIRRQPSTSHKLQSTPSTNSVHISSAIKRHQVHRTFITHLHQPLVHDLPDLLYLQVIQLFLQSHHITYQVTKVLLSAYIMTIVIPIIQYQVNQDFMISIHRLIYLLDHDNIMLVLEL